MKENKYCLGCGAIKQTNDEKTVGYVKDFSHLYCLECYSLKNYGKTSNHFHPNRYLDIKPNSLVLIFQSIMQLDLLFSQPIERIQPNARYIYVINQMDLLPPETNLDKLYQKIKMVAYKQKIKHEDIIFMSALNKNDTKNLKEYLLSFKQKDIYLFGYQNSGKTTILKALTDNKTALNINKAGLTQNVITDLLKDKVIHDMPGNYVKGYLTDFFEYKDYKNLLPKKTIKPLVYHLTNKQKFILNDFIEIKANSDVTTLVFYINKYNKINRFNLKNKDANLTDNFTYQIKTFKIPNKKMHITIADLGFILLDANTTIEIKHPKGMHITIMESLIWLILINILIL